MEALDILKAARARIADPKDWGKGARFERPVFETCCAAEAIEEASPHAGKERLRAYRALERAAGISSEWGGIPKWNDQPKRTHAEVIAAFNLAIATLRLR